ncbi:MAG: flagellar hook protein FlgE [Sulfuricurvum sp.]|nr:flagellar hook protein FlgE [Sulfuricurvum sp.]
MLRSLFAGVTGLQAHQIAMDVESNNIANVNTIGYKYSRANFSDLLAQTAQIATAPQGQLGGKNAVQIGLGTTINSVTRIMTQGSIQNTDKNTDVAIQGDGFFIVSSDSGSTYKYSRSGDFKFDAGGNFVDNGGFIVQGWLRDPITNKVDSTAPITNINIPPGLTTPANPTADVNLKANLDSGETVETYNVTKPLETYSLTNYLLNVPADVALHTANTAAAEDMKVMFNDQGKSLTLQNNQGIYVSYKTAVENKTVLPIVGPSSFSFVINGTTVSGTTPGTGAAADAGYIAQQINSKTALTGVVATATLTALRLTNDNTRESNLDSTKNIRITGADANSIALGVTDSVATTVNTTAYKYQYDPNAVDLSNTAAPIDYTFKTTEQLRLIMQEHAGLVAGATGTEVIINSRGQYEFKNNAVGALGNDLQLQVTAFADSVGNITKNTRFTEVMQAIDGALIEGSTGIRLSQSLNAATHSASIDIYDSLGSKHTLKMDFRKTNVNSTTGATWSMHLSVPVPGEINTIAPFNEINGQVSFSADGSLSSYTPTSVNFSGNNGSAPNQNVNIKLGTSNSFDGITSFDATSGTSGISQDGFPGGDLVGIRIDQSGTLVGSFSNGRSFGLAQIGMAKFTNNEGLVADGGNVFLQSANSGDPIIGTAATAGRGFMQSSALEASNVDLSKSLTNLIIIQRGYQANGKTITTSDTLLETLLGIKR